MKYKVIFLITILLILNLLLLSGCTEYIEYLIGRTGSLESDYEPEEDMIPEEDLKKLDEAYEEAEKEIQDEGLPEEPESYPRNIKLKGYIWEGSVLILNIDMYTQKVEGSVTFESSNDSYNGEITEGKIDLDTFEITARCCGLWVDKQFEDASGEECLDIKGKLSDDYKEASGMAEVWSGPNAWNAFSVD